MMKQQIARLMCVLCISQAGTATATEYEAIKYAIDTDALETAFTELQTAANNKALSSVETDILTSLLLIESGKPTRGIEVIQSAELRTTRLGADISEARARAYLALGDYDMATKAATEALQAKSSNLGAQLVLLQIDNYMNNQLDHEAYESLLKQSNQDLSVWLAYLEQTLRFEPDRLDIAKRAFVEVGSMGLIQEYRGRFAFQAGKHGSAVNLFEAALAQYRSENNEIGANRVSRWLAINSHIDSTAPPSAAVPQPKQRENIAPKDPAPQIAPPLVDTPAALDQDIEPIKVVTQGDIQTGSGFITRDGQWIVTNRHVIETADRILVRNGSGKIRHVSEVRMDDDQDLAILVLEEPYPQDFSASLDDIIDPVGGDELYLMGYPLIAILGDHHPSITEGIVSKESGFGDRESEFLITANLNQGNSGGPIFALDGRILGIAVAKLDKTKMFKETGDIPEDVNIGIKGSQIRRFLALDAPPRSSSRPLMSPREAYSLLRKQVVMVVSIDD